MNKSVKPYSILVPVDAMDAAIAFFQDTLELVLKFRDSSRYAAFEFGGLTLALLGEDERIIDHPAICVRVDDIALTCARAQEGGANIVGNIEQGAHEKRVVMRVPGGGLVVLSEKTI